MQYASGVQLQVCSVPIACVCMCRYRCCGLPWVHEVDVATQLRLNGRQLLHALLHLHMELQMKPTSQAFSSIVSIPVVMLLCTLYHKEVKCPVHAAQQALCCNAQKDLQLCTQRHISTGCPETLNCYKLC